jgi:hypothetical protein
MHDSETEREQEEAAAAEAAAIGGRVDGEDDEAMRPLAEAGQGQSEGFEEAERELVEHASHGDQHAARRVIRDAPDEVDDPRAAEDAEVDALRSTELEEDEP